MTYGWAILIMLVVISVLFYLGILNPRGVAPNSLTFPAGFSAYDYKMDAGGNLYLDLGQAVGQQIIVTHVMCSTVEGGESPSGTSVGSIPISSGEHAVLATGNVPCTGGGSGSFYKGKVTVYYNYASGGFSHKVVGDLSYRGSGGSGGPVPTNTPSGTVAPTNTPGGPTGTPSGDVSLSGTVYEEDFSFIGPEGRKLSLAQGDPVEGAQVTFIRFGGGSYSDVTGSGGTFDVDVPPGYYYRLKISKDTFIVWLCPEWEYIDEGWSNEDFYLMKENPEGSYGNGMECWSDNECYSGRCYRPNMTDPGMCCSPAFCLGGGPSVCCSEAGEPDVYCAEGGFLGYTCDLSQGSYLCVDGEPGGVVTPTPEPTSTYAPTPTEPPVATPTPTSCAGPGQIEVSSCQDLTRQSGEVGGMPVILDYVLCDDIVESSGLNCLQITEDGVPLNCNGHTISGTGTGTGIFVGLGITDVTVQGCGITGFAHGLHMEDVSSSLFSNNVINNCDRGVHLYNSDSNEFSGNIVTQNNAEDFYCIGSTSNLDGGNTCEKIGCGDWLASCPPTPVPTCASPITGPCIVTSPGQYTVSSSFTGCQSESNLVDCNGVPACICVDLVDNVEISCDGDLNGPNSGHGILVSRSQSSSVTSCEIHSFSRGILTTNADYVSLSFNNLFSNLIYGMEVGESTGAIITENMVCLNGQGGIRAYNLVDSVFSENRVDSNSNYGFMLDSGVTGNSFTGNNVASHNSDFYCSTTDANTDGGSNTCNSMTGCEGWLSSCP